MIEDSSEAVETVWGDKGGKGKSGVSGVFLEGDGKGTVICVRVSIVESVISGSSGNGSLWGMRCSMFVEGVNSDNSNSSEGSGLVLGCRGREALRFWRHRECRNTSVFGIRCLVRSLNVNVSMRNSSPQLSCWIICVCEKQ